MAKPRKALICGVTGQDGSLLAAHLLQEGFEVHGTTRDAQACQLKNLVRLSIDQSVRLHSMAPHDFRSVFGVLKAVEPERIFFQLLGEVGELGERRGPAWQPEQPRGSG